MNKNTSIRLALPGDAINLSEMNREFNGCMRPIAAIAASLAVGGELVAIALADGSAAGFACAQHSHSFCYEPGQGEVTELYVRPAFRRRGIAADLLAFLEKELQKQGVNDIKILTGAENSNAIRVYERMGYRKKNETVLQKGLQHGAVDL